MAKGAVIPASGLEAALVRKSPAVWFETHGTILDKLRRKVRYPELRLNWMQLEIDRIVQFCERERLPCRIVTLKGRQQGSSTISVAEVYRMLQKKVVKACIIGDSFDKSVKNLIGIFETFAANDTYRWGNTYNRASKVFSHGSELVTETANDPRAGASGTYQCVLCTEVAHWAETTVISGKATFAALLNCVPEAPETLIIVESTPAGVGGVYYSTYTKGVKLDDYIAGRIPPDWNGFFQVFYPWHRHPEYDGEVDAEKTLEIMSSLTMRETEMLATGELGVSRLAWRRKMLASPRFNHDEDLLEQEFPFDEETCFLLSGARVFPLAQVQAMRRKAETGEALRVEYGTLNWMDSAHRRAAFQLTSQDDSFLKVWERPRAGYRYVLAADPCTGASQTVGGDTDSHGIGIIRAGLWDEHGRWRPHALVARLADGWAESRSKTGAAVCKWDIDVTAERIALLSLWYGGATVAVEVNMDRGLIELLKAKGGINLYRRQLFNRVSQVTTESYGWKTDVQTRPGLIETLVRRVRIWDEPGDGIEISDLAVIAELGGMVSKANGRAEAMTGMHDDNVFMLAIGLAVIESAHVMAPIRRVGFDDDELERRPHSTYQ